MCLCKQGSVEIGVCMCVIINQISSRQLLVCVLLKHSQKGCKCAHHMCVCSCTHKIKGGHEFVSVRHHHSPSTATCERICVYICMLTPLNDCDYIRQFFTINYEVLCIKNNIVFPYNCTMQPSQQPTQKTSQTLSPDMPIIIIPSIIKEA